MKELSANFDCYGLEISESAIKKMEDFPDINVEYGSVTNIPFDLKFDVIFLTDAIEHLTQNQIEKGLINIRNKLNPNGKLLITTPYNEDLSKSKVMCPKCRSTFHVHGHLHAFHFDTLSKIISNAGFNLIDIGILDKESHLT